MLSQTHRGVQQKVPTVSFNVSLYFRIIAWLGPLGGMAQLFYYYHYQSTSFAKAPQETNGACNFFYVQSYTILEQNNLFLVNMV